VDRHADLLRESAADVGNDHRLGANEAPPAIVSVYLGEQLEDVLAQWIRKGEATHSLKGERLRTGVATLPDFRKDATDRNRTSPFAFTGNKFEFRMVGSRDSVAAPNVVLNTIVAEAFCEACDILENAEDFDRGYGIHRQHLLDLRSMVELEISHTTNTCRHHKQLNVLIGSEGIELIFVKIEKVAVIVVVCILVEHPVIWARPVAYLEIIASLYKSFTDGKPNPVTAANYYCFFLISHLFTSSNSNKAHPYRGESNPPKQHEML
jgi:hypothetical protein